MPKSPQLPIIWKSAQDFLLSSLAHRQSWLNILMDHCHFEQHHKMGKKKKQCTLMVGFLLKGNKLDHKKLEVPRVNRPHTKHHSLIEHILVHTNVGEWL